MKKRNWKVLLLSFIIVFGIAFIGNFFTSDAVKTDWYESIKPSITPPNFVFPIVWNALFILIALSLYSAWIGSEKNQKKIVAIVFGISLAFNALWSVLFFSLRNPRAAFIEIIALWLSILAMIFVSWRIDRKAAWMLLPYLLWVSFASVLNFLMAF